MTPSEHFNKPVIGKLVTRTIDRLSLDGVPSSIKDEKEYEIIDVMEPDEDGNLFVVNEWENESLNVVLAIHSTMVKETNLEKK